MRIGYVQTNPTFGAVEENHARVAALVATDHADLWVLPELFATGYQFRSRAEALELAEPVPDGPTCRFLMELARIHNCHFVAGMAERVDSRVYNTAVLVAAAGVRARYRKLHLFSAEKLWFSPGDTPLAVSDIGGVRVGMMVCFDHLFPETARTLALAGADVIAHPANLVLPEYGQLTMRVRALENGVFTVTANRVGEEHRGDVPLHFTGASQIVAPSGEVLVRGTDDQEEARTVVIDPNAARDKAITLYNDRFADRRPKFYRC